MLFSLFDVFFKSLRKLEEEYNYSSYNIHLYMFLSTLALAVCILNTSKLYLYKKYFTNCLIYLYIIAEQAVL